MDEDGSREKVLDGVLERLEALEAENARLAAELVALSGSGRQQRDAGPACGDERPGGVSRRRVLGGAAATAAALVAGGAVGTDQAAAGSDGDLTLGVTSNSASAPTGLAVGRTTSSYGIGVTDNGLNSYPSTEQDSALFGHAHEQNFQCGVFGYSDVGAFGVRGVSVHPGGLVGTGVYGRGAPGVMGESDADHPAVSGQANGTGAGVSGQGPTGVIGTTPFGGGIGVHGIGSPGVKGVADALEGPGGTAIQGTNGGSPVVVNGSVQNAPASGIGVLAENTDDGFGPPTASSIALAASNAGSGAGVKATSRSGLAVLGQITNASNPSPAVYGSTNGGGAALKGDQTGGGYGVNSQIANSANSRAAVNATTNGSGPAVQGTQSGASGNALYGQITSASNSSGAVRGAGATAGRGGVFSGGAAQVRLVPGGSTPKSGQTGDLFVDSGGHLHYCKAGGSTASWVQLA